MKQQKRWTRIVIGGVAVLALAIGGLWGFAQDTGVASAQETVARPDQGSLMKMRGGFGHGALGRFGQGLDGSDVLLANALGITNAELQAARQTAFESGLDQAVEDGLLTEEQADQLKSGSGFRFRGMHGALTDQDKDVFLAEALGITVEELEVARDSMSEKGVEAGLLTEAQGNDLAVRKMVRDAAHDSIEATLQEAVEAGLITQEQADTRLNGRSGGFRGFGGFGNHGFGGRGGFRGNRGFGRGFDDSQFLTPDTPAPSTSNL